MKTSDLYYSFTAEDYLIDKLEVKLTFLFTHRKKYKDGYRAIPELSSKSFLKRGGKSQTHYPYFLLHTHSFNCNRFLNQYYRALFSITRTDSSYTIADNVIPFKARIEMAQNSIIISDARSMAISHLLKELIFVKKEIQNFIKKKYRVNINSAQVKMSLHHVETNFDILLKSGVDLTSLESFREELFKQTVGMSKGTYVDDGGNKTLQLKVSSLDEEINPQGNYLKGYLSNGSHFLMYQKEVNKDGGITRFETRYNGRDVLSKLIKNVRFDNKEELTAKLDELGHATFAIINNALNPSNPLSDKAKNKFTMFWIKRFFGKDYEIAAQLLLKPPYCIYTGSKEGSNKSLTRKVRQLAKNDVLVVKKGTALYSLNNDWIIANKHINEAKLSPY